MLVGREMEIKDDLTWNPPTWPPRGARGEISSIYNWEKFPDYNSNMSELRMMLLDLNSMTN